MKTTHTHSALERLLLALEQELLNATDEEVFAAARELGMNPTMKGSSAFFGVTILVRPLIMSRTRSWILTADEEPSNRRPRRGPKGDTPI
jgi:hypothetical protein